MGKTLEASVREETFEGALRTVDTLPDSINVDKTAANQNLIHYWSENHPLVRKFIINKTTPAAEIEKLAKIIGGLKAFIPNYVKQEEMHRIEELEQVFGGMHKDYSTNFSHLLLNPIGGGVIGAGLLSSLYLAMSYVPGSGLQPVDLATFSIAGAALGAFCGGIGSGLKLYGISDLRKQSKYLESKITQITSQPA